MKLLLDANVSWRLCAGFKLHFEDCFHVDNIGLTVPAKDTEIWNYALSINLIIITNDEDFLNFSNIKGFPPKIILLKTGNQSSKYIEELIIRHKRDIESLYLSNDYGILELF